MRKHVFYDDGLTLDGEPLRRCYGCGVAAHWPAAQTDCNAAFFKSGIPQMPRDGTTKWPGPYRKEPPTKCGHCGDLFVRAKYQHRVRYCGPVCSVAVAKVRHNEGRKRWPSARHR